MSEWWTYSLSDFLLFSPRAYYRLFELYNAAIWPAQILALALGLLLIAVLLRPASWRARAAAAILAAAWLWVTWFYLLGHYDTINWAASYFAIGFAIEVLLLWTVVVPGRFRPCRPSMRLGAAGLGMVAFAVAFQPLIGTLVVGRPWTQIELFGLAPDPTVVATLGVLVAAERPQWLLVALPLLWCLISGATLWTMQSPDAAVMPAAAAIALALTVRKSLARPA